MWLILLKKQRSSFFQKNQPFLSNAGFTINISEGFIDFLGKTDHRMQLLPGEHLLLSRAPTSHKIFKLNQSKVSDFHEISFLTKSCSEN